MGPAYGGLIIITIRGLLSFYVHSRPCPPPPRSPLQVYHSESSTSITYTLNYTTISNIPRARC